MRVCFKTSSITYHCNVALSLSYKSTKVDVFFDMFHNLKIYGLFWNKFLEFEEELSRASQMDDALLNKVKAVSKMADYYDNVAEDNDLAVKMKGIALTPNNSADSLKTLISPDNFSCFKGFKISIYLSR